MQSEDEDELIMQLEQGKRKRKKKRGVDAPAATAVKENDATSEEAEVALVDSSLDTSTDSSMLPPPTPKTAKPDPAEVIEISDDSQASADDDEAKETPKKKSDESQQDYEVEKILDYAWCKVSVRYRVVSS